MSHYRYFHCRTHNANQEDWNLKDPDHLQKIWLVRREISYAQENLWLGLLFYDAEGSAIEFAIEHMNCDVCIRSEYWELSREEKYPDIEVIYD